MIDVRLVKTYNKRGIPDRIFWGYKDKDGVQHGSRLGVKFQNVGTSFPVAAVFLIKENIIEELEKIIGEGFDRQDVRFVEENLRPGNVHLEAAGG